MPTSIKQFFGIDNLIYTCFFMLNLNFFPLFKCFCFVCSQDLADQFSPGGPRSGGNHLRHGIASLLPSARGGMMSPPMSPMKKKLHDPDKPKRPMNGFMLFAKKFRLELIQQHPGKDNRQILFK